ncbi:MAG TPA: hypothetical protein VFB62_26215 [Polyangiaceae bacterium]|nr:hypothetical protein [Polyangiaceae bacterium]
MRTAISALCSSSVLLLAGSLAAQEEEDAALKPQVMREPGHVVDVIDAFDDDNGDPFDIAVTLGFEYFSKRARILRESSVFAPGLTTGGYTSKLQNVGEYIETTSKLTPRLDIGVFKDLAVFARIPIVLSNSRRIDPIDGSDGNQPAVLQGAPGEQLFTLPFEAPDRSGVEYVAIGVDFGIFNQARDRTKPTWVIGFEARIRAGEEMHPCNENPPAGQVKCAHEGDIDRNGDSTNPDAQLAPLEAVDAEEQDAGVTRGTVGLELHTLMSKRLKYIEPYGGFNALFEFRQGGSGFNVTDLEGALVNHPPYVGTVLVGMMIHPWENREAFQRITLDVRFQGEYHSEGRDYGELFDALGSSPARSLRTPKWARFTETPTARSVVDQSSEKIYYTGLSVVEAYGSYRAAGSVTWRAGQYVRLSSGVGLRFDQAHGITHDQPCNPDFKDNLGEAGPCHSGSEGNEVATGIPNPAYRPSVNAIGRRFYVDESITYEIFASGLVMF